MLGNIVIYLNYVILVAIIVGGIAFYFLKVLFL